MMSEGNLRVGECPRCHGSNVPGHSCLLDITIPNNQFSDDKELRKKKGAGCGPTPFDGLIAAYGKRKEDPMENNQLSKDDVKFLAKFVGQKFDGKVFYHQGDDRYVADIHGTTRYFNTAWGREAVMDRAVKKGYTRGNYALKNGEWTRNIIKSTKSLGSVIYTGTGLTDFLAFVSALREAEGKPNK
jgi:hypothetical protein